jgi:hypothetical protein
MHGLDVNCIVQNTSVSVPSDLLMKNAIKIDGNVIEFPENISIKDLHVYTNFLHTGYLHKDSFWTVIKIVTVADFLSQEHICDVLTKSLIVPSISHLNCLQVLTSFQDLSLPVYSIVSEACVSFISTNLSIFASSLELFPDHVLVSVFERNFKDRYFNEVLIEAIKVHRECEDYIQLLVKEDERIIQSDLSPELELTWRIDNDDSIETDVFEFNSTALSLFLNIGEELTVELIEKNKPEAYYACRGIAILQGTSSHFMHLFGTSSQKISQVSKKTKTTTLTLMLKEEPLFYYILIKAAQELNINSDYSFLPLHLMILLTKALKITKNTENLLEIIGNWYTNNPCEASLDLLDETGWRSFNVNVLFNFIQKFPAFKNIPEFKNFSNDKIMSEGFQDFKCEDKVSKEFLEDDEHACAPLSPSGNPFLLEISEIKTAPTSNKKEYTENATVEDESFLFASSLTSTNYRNAERIYDYKNSLKSNTSQIHIREKKSNNKPTALEMIKNLKKKLINSRPQGQVRLFMYLKHLYHQSNS